MKKPKIKLYEKRSFSNKLSTVFDFMSENFKVMLRFLVYLLLPVSILQAMSINSMASSILLGTLKDFDGDEIEALTQLGGWYFVSVIACLVGSILVTALVFGLIKVYGERHERLDGLTFGEFRPTLVAVIKRIIKLTLTLTGYAILLCAIAVLVIGGLYSAAPVLGGTLIILAFIALCIVIVPLMLAAPIYIFEDITVNRAIAKAIRLGFRTWAGIIGVVFVLSLICQMVAVACMMPWYIMTIIKGVFAMQDNADGAEFVSSPVYSIINYLLGIVYIFGTYASCTLVYVGLAIQYGHAAEKIDGVSVAHDVDRFEELADNNDDDSRLFEKRDDIDNFENI